MRQINISIKNSEVFLDVIARYEKEGWVKVTPVTRSVKQGTFHEYWITLRISEFRWALVYVPAILNRLKWYISARLDGWHPDFGFWQLFKADPFITKV
jgi:hypothetical protein